MFTKGHPYYKGAGHRKGRCGRKKSPGDVMRYLTEQIDSNWGVLVERLIEQAKNGDREALLYCFDRRLGKPKATTEIEGGEALGAGLVLQILAVIAEQRRLSVESRGLLKEGDTIAHGTGEEGLSERVDTAEESKGSTGCNGAEV